MSVLETFVIKFASDLLDFRKGAEEASAEGEKTADSVVKSLTEAAKSGEKLSSTFMTMAKGAAGWLGVGLSIKEFAGNLGEMAENYDNLDKLAARFRTTADAIDDFGDAGEILGLTEEQIVGGLTSLDRAIGDTALGMGRAKAVFEEVGVKALDAGGKMRPVTDVMNDLAGKLKNMERGKAIAVMERLGLDPALMKVFNADFESLGKRFTAIDSAAGFNFDTVMKRSKDFMKAMRDMKVESNFLQKYFDTLFEASSSKFLPALTKGLMMATTILRRTTDFFMAHENVVTGALIAIGAAVSYFLIPPMLAAAGAALIMMAPFLVVGAAVAAVAGIFALLYDDVMAFLDGQESMIGEMSKTWPALGECVRLVADGLRLFGDVAQAVLGLVADLILDPEQAWENFVAAIDEGVSRFVNSSETIKSGVAAIGGAFDALGQGVTAVWDSIAGAIRSAVDTVSGAIETVSTGYNRVKSALGLGDDGPTDAIAKGQAAINVATSTPLASQTSSSIANSNQIVSRDTAVTIGKVEVQTQATDADGISKAIGGSLNDQMRQAVNNFDDGVAG